VLIAYALALSPWISARADALKDEAIERLVASHDPAIPVAIGRLYIKQVGLDAIRALLTRHGRQAGLDKGWNSSAPEWREAEAMLVPIVDEEISRQIDDSGWLSAAWRTQAARVLGAEEADVLATHFDTAIGKEQRIVVELLIIGETLLANYTMTDRIRANVKGAERELEHLQKVFWSLDPFRVRDFTNNPIAVKFASQDPGVKYMKMLAIQGIEVIINHFDMVAKAVTRKIENDAVRIDPAIEAYRQRTSSSAVR
jgi:hypothetical protein